jgi:hypothetical protein
MLRLYCSSEKIPSAVSFNNGIEYVMYLLWLVSQKGVGVEIMDTARMSDNDVQAAYKSAQIPSIAKKLSIRRIFGTKHESGHKFGREVPALIVYDGTGHPIDVYPHGKGMHKEKTIRQYLFGLLPEGQQVMLLERWRATGSGFDYFVADDLLEFKLDYKKKKAKRGKGQ